MPYIVLLRYSLNCGFIVFIYSFALLQFFHTPIFFTSKFIHIKFPDDSDRFIGFTMYIHRYIRIYIDIRCALLPCFFAERDLPSERDIEHA